MQRAGIQEEMEQARLDFDELVKRATAEDLRRRTAARGGPTGNCCFTWCSAT
jgi:hypothetical protein